MNCAQGKKKKDWKIYCYIVQLSPESILRVLSLKNCDSLPYILTDCSRLAGEFLEAKFNTLKTKNKLIIEILLHHTTNSVNEMKLHGVSVSEYSTFTIVACSCKGSK
jgi:hypothetical protein